MKRTSQIPIKSLSFYGGRNISHFTAFLSHQVLRDSFL